jgi:hypothetical protein
VQPRRKEFDEESRWSRASGTNRVEVNVANELEQVRFLLDEDALEAVLKRCPARRWMRLKVPT